MYNVLFLGQKWAGERCFDLLTQRLGSQMRLCGVVSNTSPDVWWRSNRIHRTCVGQRIPFVGNERRNNDAIRELMDSLKVNLLLSVQHPWILPPDILARVNYQGFNIHNARLPEYKGYNACNHVILNQETEYISTLHWLVDLVDAGAVAFEESVPILPEDTARSLYDKALDATEVLFTRLLDCLLEGKPVPRIPIQGEGTFYPRDSINALRQIQDPTDAAEVDLKSRALFFPPFEPSFYLLDGKKVYVLPVGFERYAHEFLQPLNP